jgi:two-component system catabolic regulation response regulator CreB
MPDRPRILLIEDEKPIADVLAYALQTEGFEIRWVPTAGEALAALASASPDLVILDIGLPDRSGFELFEEIRSRHAVPVIFLTARGSEVDRVAGLEMGADDYVVKPFSPREVAARARAVLRRGRSAPAAAAPGSRRPHPFSVDAPRRTITYFGEPLELTRYEYRILETLLEHPGWVFTRERLMELVWECPEMSLDRTVDTHIKTLRAKLRSVRHEPDPIVTHRGVGYALREDW